MHVRDPRCGRPPATGPMVAMPSSGEIPGCAGCGCADDDQQARRDFGSKATENKDKGEDGDGDEQGGQMHLGQPAADFEELDECFVGVGWNADHLTEDRDADLKAYSGEKADEYGSGEKVGDEAELEQAGEQQKNSGEQCDQTSQRYVSRAGRRRHAGESAAKNGGSGGVGGDDEIARRAEGCEREKRQQERVEAGDDGHAGDAGVAEGLRDVHCGEDDAGECIAHGAGSLHRFYSLEQTQQIKTPAQRGDAAAQCFFVMRIEVDAKSNFREILRNAAAARTSFRRSYRPLR